MTDAYGEKALEAACEKIRTASKGERNDMLNVEAYSLGGLIATDRIERSEVERALMQAAVSVGLPRDEAEKTIISGIRSGMRHPRWVDDRKEPWAPKATPVQPPSYEWEPKDPENPPEAWIDQVHTLLAWAHEKLLNNPAQLEQLKRRGIHRRTVQKFVLGFNPGKGGKDIFREPDKWGLPERDKKMWLPVGLVIPCFVNGRVVRLRFRRQKGEPRYVILPGSSGRCFACENSVARAAIVVESELDAMLLEQEVGDWCSIVALGSAGIRPDAQTHELLRYHEVIFVALDYDEAGAKEYRWWQHQYSQAVRLVTPEGKDPGEAQRTIDVRAWIQVALHRTKLGSLERI